MDKIRRSLCLCVLYGCESELFRFVFNNYIPSTFNVSLFHYRPSGLRVLLVHITTGGNEFALSSGIKSHSKALHNVDSFFLTTKIFV